MDTIHVLYSRDYDLLDFDLDAVRLMGNLASERLPDLNRDIEHNVRPEVLHRAATHGEAYSPATRPSGLSALSVRCAGSSAAEPSPARSTSGSPVDWSLTPGDPDG